MSEQRTPALSVLFVCLGNICRSPTAQVVFEAQLANSLLAGQVHTDSAGTADYHIGKAPDPRSRAAARQRGYDLDPLRARQVTVDDFHRFDYILAMDADNLRQLKTLEPQQSRAIVGLFLEFADAADRQEVPDPYFGAEDGFETVLDLCEQASQGLLAHLQAGKS